MVSSSAASTYLVGVDLSYISLANSCVRFNDVKGGVRYGKLSLKLADRFKSSVWLNRTMMCYYGTIYPRRYPVEGTLEALRTVNRLALRFADVEYAVVR